MAQHKQVLRDEHFKIGLLQNLKRRSRGVLIQRRHPVHLKEVVFWLHVPRTSLWAMAASSTFLSIGVFERLSRSLLPS